MYRLALTILLAILVTACASPQQKAQIAEFYSWQSNRQAQAKAGQVPWSSYYTELWTRLSQMPDDPQKPLAMSTTAELIPIARSYEAGQLTKEQFEDLRRIIISRTNQERQITLQQQKAIDDAQAEQLFKLSNQIMQPRNPTTNCLTSRVGQNQLSTTCR